MSKPTPQQVEQAAAVIERSGNEDLLRLCFTAMIEAAKKGVSHEVWALLDSDDENLMIERTWLIHFTKGR